MRTLLLFFVFHALTFESNAQAMDFKGGLMFGPVTSQISGDGLGGWDKFGIAAGGYVSMSKSDDWEWIFSMLYTNKGSAKPADPNNGDYTKFKYVLRYVDVPIYVKYNRKNLFFTTGLYAGVLLTQVQVNDGAESTPYPEFEPFDFGGSAGIGYSPGERWEFEFRGQASIIPIRPSPPSAQVNYYYQKGLYSQMLQLLFSYSF